MRVSHWVSNLFALMVLLLIGTYGTAQSPQEAGKEAIKDAAKAIDIAKARQSLDHAKRSQDAAKERSTPAVPKDEADSVKRALDAAKAKQRGAVEHSQQVETLPIPRRVLDWETSCEVPPCEECSRGCACVACVCESVTAHPAPKPEPRFVQVTVDRWKDEEPKPWIGGAIPQGLEWVGVVGNGYWRKAGQVPSNPFQLMPVTFAVSPCASGNCPNVQPTRRR